MKTVWIAMCAWLTQESLQNVRADFQKAAADGVSAEEIGGIANRCLAVADAGGDELTAIRTLIELCDRAGVTPPPPAWGTAVERLANNYSSSPKVMETLYQLSAVSPRLRPAARQAIQAVQAASKVPLIQGGCMLAEVEQVMRRNRETPLPEDERLATIQLLKSVEARFGDSPTPFGYTFGEIASSHRYELEHLHVGMIAPDIAGADMEGTAFKLSDYRGKVVVLDFYGLWCGTCRGTFPHLVKLGERLEDRPFVLLGVNSDADKASAWQGLAEKGVAWRSFWNGPKGTKGPIATRWNVRIWPTLYGLDPEGRIRFKNLHGEALDQALDRLLKEVEAAGR